MKLIKRILAEIHLAFAGLFNRQPQHIVVPDGEQHVETPIGLMNIWSPRTLIEKTTVTWYGVRKTISYWRHDTTNIVVGSTVWAIV